jgi:hypothetical protein
MGSKGKLPKPPTAGPSRKALFVHQKFVRGIYRGADCMQQGGRGSAAGGRGSVVWAGGGVGWGRGGGGCGAGEGRGGGGGARLGEGA